MGTTTTMTSPTLMIHICETAERVGYHAEALVVAVVVVGRARGKCALTWTERRIHIYVWTRTRTEMKCPQAHLAMPPSLPV